MKFRIIIILLLISNILLSQNKSVEKISWNSPYEEGGVVFLSFDNANYNEDYLPIFVKKIKVNQTDYSVKLTNQKFSPLTKAESDAIQKIDFPELVKIESKVFKSRKNKFLNIEFVPLRRNPKTNVVEKLSSFEISYTPINRTKSISSLTSNVNSSEMGSGDWAKIGVVKTGVYKISYNQIKNLRNRINNNVDNLVWLCHNCHHLVHYYEVDQEKFMVPMV